MKEDEFEWLFCDIETLAPSSDNPTFWYGGIIKYPQMEFWWTDSVETYLERLILERKRKKKVCIFFNAQYDVSILQWHMRDLWGYKLNPIRPGVEGGIYTGQKTEIFPPQEQLKAYHHGKIVSRYPVSIVDCQPILSGSIRSWGKALGLPKGDTPLYDTYHRPTKEELAYLKRDIEIELKACEKLCVMQSIMQGRLTISSVVHGEVKTRMADLGEGTTHIMGFRPRHALSETLKDPLPPKIYDRIERAVQSYYEHYTARDSRGKPLYGPRKDEREEVRSRLIRIYMKALRDRLGKTKMAELEKTKDRRWAKLDVPFDPPDDYFKPVHEKWLKREALTACNTAIRPGLRGGISWVNPRYKDKILPPGFTLDINSMYPSVILDTDLPYAYEGMDYGTPRLDKYFVTEIIKLDATVKPGCHPWLKRSTRYTSDAKYLPHIHWEGKPSRKGGVWDTILTSADFLYMQETYDIAEIKVGRIFYFKDDQAFTQAIRDHVTHWRRVKETSTGADRQYAKLQLNSMWGRWGMTDKKVKDAGRTIQVGDPTSNLVSALFTTAYARIRLNRMVNRLYDYVVYTDTDSVHVLFPPGKTQADMEAELAPLLDPKKFGKWKIEQTWTRAKYIKAKTYCHEDTKGTLAFTSAGVPRPNIVSSIKSLEDFTPGKTFKVIKKVVLPDGRQALRSMPTTL